MTHSRALAAVKAATEQSETKKAALLNMLKSMTIRDLLVPPKSMVFYPDSKGSLRLSYPTVGSSVDVDIHPWALTQMCKQIRVPPTFAKELLGTPWKVEVLSFMLTSMFLNWNHKEGTLFLHRIVGGTQLRGFLSRRFNNKLSSPLLAEAFLVSAGQMGAVPVETYSSGVRYIIRCYTPHIHEPVPGEYVCIGVEWRNSDFGQGVMEVGLSIWHPATGNKAIMSQAHARRHLGSILRDSDMELSDEASRKEVEAQVIAMDDAVRACLSQEMIDSLLNAIKDASQKKTYWSEVRATIGRLLGRDETKKLDAALRAGTALDLPPATFDMEDPEVSWWWAHQVMASLANRETDQDKREKLEEGAGSYLVFSKE